MHSSGLATGRRVRLGQVRSAHIISLILILLSTLVFAAPAFAATPAVGAKAPDFTLSTPTGKAVCMSKEQQGHELVLVVLRGFPGTSAHTVSNRSMTSSTTHLILRQKTPRCSSSIQDLQQASINMLKSSSRNRRSYPQILCSSRIRITQ